MKNTNPAEYHLEYIRNIKDLLKDKSLFERLSSTESFELACNLIETDAEDYIRFMEHKLHQTWGLGIAIGVGISLIGIFITLIFMG